MSNEPKWTKGPWYTPCFAQSKNGCDCRYVLSDSYAGSIAEVSVDNGKMITDGGNDSPPLEEAIANARLIAAAPELYEALSGLLAESELFAMSIPAYGASEALAAARAALAKAVQ